LKKGSDQPHEEKGRRTAHTASYKKKKEKKESHVYFLK